MHFCHLYNSGAGEEGREWALEKLGPTGEAGSQDLLSPGRGGRLGPWAPTA